MKARTLAIIGTCIIALVGCQPSATEPTPNPAATSNPTAIADDISYSSRGSSSRGQILYARCASCHATSSSMGFGPGMAGLFSAEGPRLPSSANYNGMLPNGKERTETNIAEWITTGGQGAIGFMPSQPLEDQDLADLIAYLRTIEP